MKCTMHVDIDNAQRRYSEQAVMNLLRIGRDDLRKLEQQGKLNLSRDFGPVGYPGEQVDTLIHERNKTRSERVSHEG